MPSGKPTHLKKLDVVQKAAERIGNFTVESLGCRREAAAIAFTLKLLNGDGRGVLKDYVPTLITEFSNKDFVPGPRHEIRRLQLADRSKNGSLDIFRDSYLGSIHKIWAKLPVELIERGLEKGWRKITTQCKDCITGRVRNKKKKGSKPKKIKVMIGAEDGFKIDGFGESRKCEFDDSNNMIKSSI